MWKTGFIPYSMKIIEVKVLSYERKILRGVLSSLFCVDDMPFEGYMQLLLLMEHIQEQLGYPEPGMETRTFAKTEPLAEVDAPEVDKKEKPMAVFRIFVFFRQNSTWQGNLHWMDRNEVANFRSVFELMKLVDSALGHVEESGASPPSENDSSERSCVIFE